MNLRQLLIGYRCFLEALFYKVYLAIVSTNVLNTVNLVYLFSRNDSSTVLRTA